MSTTKIYTFSHNRPDLIRLQYESIKKYVKDDFEFIVFNNEKPGSEGGYNSDRISQINFECQKLNLQCIDIKFDDSLRVLNNQLMFNNNQYTNGVAACAYSLSWAWKNIISKDSGISVIIDSDMFLCKDVSFTSLMDGYNFAHCPSYRNNFSIMYPWNGIVIADTKNMPCPETMTWGPGIVNGVATDVGGELHHYREKYKTELKELYIDMWGVLVDTSDMEEVCVNGCAQYFVDFKQRRIRATDPQALMPPNKKTFPHQSEREDYWSYFNSNFIKIKEIANKYNFPKPTYIDLIKLESDNIDDSFIIHYKSASNYQPWATAEYNNQKTSALQQFLKNQI